MSGRRALTIVLATVATIVAVLALLLIPVSIALGRYANVLGEALVLVVCVGYVTRVMRADRRRRREAEAELPPERRPERRVPRRPITFQMRETLFAFLVWFVQWVKSRTSEFAVTNKRVIIKVGLIRRDTLELLLNKVESIGVDQTVTGRIVGYGSIVVVGTGGTRETFRNIARPLDFRKQVQARALA